MPRIFILKRSPACKFITHFERTGAERSMLLKSMLSISASLYKKNLYKFELEERFFNVSKLYRPTFGNRKITNLYSIGVVFLFLSHPTRRYSNITAHQALYIEHRSSQTSQSGLYRMLQRGFVYHGCIRITAGILNYC